jgi:hypothetical protein
MNCGTQLKDLAMETSCSFEFWDICGTSYAWFPLDAKFNRRAGGPTLSLPLRSRDSCSASSGHWAERPGCGSPKWTFACLSQWPTSAVA